MWPCLRDVLVRQPRERTANDGSGPSNHALVAGQTALVDFAGSVIADSLPRRALVLVAEWAVLHEGELAANRERTRNDEPLEPIDALA